MKIRKKRQKIPKVFLGKRVNFLDPRHGFWKIGECYREDSKTVSVRDMARKRYKVPNNANFVTLFIEDVK